MKLLPSHKLVIATDQTSLKPFLEKFEISNLDQYTDAKPFVMLLNGIATSKNRQILANILSNAPIQDYHYIYNHKKYGFTQNLSTIWEFQLVVHILYICIQF